MLTDWQRHATNAIATGLLEYEAQQLCIDESVNPIDAKKWVSLNKYPFGGRENHPYQTWLSECKLIPVFLSLDIAIKHYSWWREGYSKPRKVSLVNKKRKQTYNPDQLSLF